MRTHLYMVQPDSETGDKGPPELAVQLKSLSDSLGAEQARIGEVLRLLEEASLVWKPQTEQDEAHNRINKVPTCMSDGRPEQDASVSATISRLFPPVPVVTSPRPPQDASDLPGLVPVVPAGFANGAVATAPAVESDEGSNGRSPSKPSSKADAEGLPPKQPKSEVNRHSRRKLSVLGRRGIVDMIVRGESSGRVGKTTNVFADAEEMKEKVRSQIHAPEYSVHVYYKSEGFAQAVARSPWFEVVTLVGIIANAIWLAIDADYNEAEMLHKAEPSFILVENFFCLFFTAEWLIRYVAFECKRDCVKDGWFVFDTVLVWMMILETWAITLISVAFAWEASGSSISTLRLLRLVRMLRTARVARILRFMPELMVIVSGLVTVARTVVLMFTLVIVLVYVFAIIFVNTAKGTELEELYCSSVGTAMLNLLFGGLFPDMAEMINNMGEVNPAFAVLFVLFLIICAVTIMNMLTGVLVDVVGVVAAVEQETNQAQAIKKVLTDGLSRFDNDSDGRFSRLEFERLLQDDSFALSLQKNGVDALGLIDYMDFVFRHKKELDFPELVDLVLQCRGNNPTKVSDIVELRKFLMMELRSQRIKDTGMISARTPSLEKGAAVVPAPSDSSYTLG